MTMLDKAKERMDVCWEAEQEQRRTMMEDFAFITKDDGMWEGSFQGEVMKAKHTFDLVSPIINKMVSDQRATRIGVNCLPVSSDASTKLAEKRGGIIRAIQEDCDATDHYARAYEEAVICGLGALRVKVKYSHDDAWDQELAIEHVPSAATSVYIDPASQRPDGSDAYYGFVIHGYTDEQLKNEFDINVDEVDDFQDSQYEWKDLDTNRTRIAEYYYKEPTRKTLVLMSDGSTYDIEETDITTLQEAGLEIVKQRVCDGFKVMKAIIAGNKVIQQPEETPFNSIPIVPVYGVSRFIDAKRYSFGIVRKAKDPSRLINWVRSRTIEEAAYAPSMKIAMTKKSLEENAESVNQLTNPAFPVLPYTPDSQAPNGGLPVPVGGYTPNVGMENLAATTQGALQEIIGVFGGSADPTQTRLSGEAINMLQGRSDGGTFVYQDNLMEAIERVGELCNGALSRVYPEQRQVFILDKSGERVQEQINTPNENGVINDLSIGKYKVRMEAGASYASQRRETADKLQQLIQADPSLMQIAGDQLVKNIDLRDGGALAARLRKRAIASGIIDESEMTDDEKQEMAGAMQAQQQQAQQQQQLQDLDIQLEMQRKQLELAKLQAETQEIQSKVMVNQTKAELNQAETVKAVIESDFAMNNPNDTKAVL